jgi:hypothetical protein
MAAAAVRSVFHLHMKPLPPDDADTLVKDITNYICPLADNVSCIQSALVQAHVFWQGKDINYSRPFENEAIIQTIHQEFFSYCSKSIDKDYPDRFPGARNSWKLSNTTIALAATGVSIMAQLCFETNILFRYVLLWMNGYTAIGSPCRLQQTFILIYT